MYSKAHSTALMSLRPQHGRTSESQSQTARERSLPNARLVHLPVKGKEKKKILYSIIVRAKLSPQLTVPMSSDLTSIPRSRDKTNCVDFVGKGPFPHLHTMVARQGRANRMQKWESWRRVGDEQLLLGLLASGHNDREGRELLTPP